MPRKIVLLWLCLSSFLFSATFDLQVANNDYQEDLNLLTSKILKYHPGLYGDTPILDKNIIEEKYTESMEKLQNVDSLVDFYFTASEFLTYLDDGHARVNYGLFDGRLLPIHFTWINGELFVTKSYNPKYEDCVYKKVTKINGMDVLDFEKEVNRYLSSDYNNIYQQRKEIYGNNYNFIGYDFHKQICPEITDSCSLTFFDGTSIDVAFESWEDYEEIAYTLITCRNEITAVEFENTVKLLKDDNAAYLQVTTKKMTPDFLHSMFRSIEENNIDNLIVDLRNCGGGHGGESLVLAIPYLISEPTNVKGLNAWNVENGQLIASKGNYPVFPMKPVEEYSFKGKVYVFVNGFTFSAANLSTLILKNNNLATIIGEPTGNNYTRFGQALRTKLPNSKLKAKFSVKLWENINGENDFEKAIEPDILVRPTIDNYINHTDPLWDYYLENLVTK